jgi:small subunit ribosomal protein S7
MSRRKAAAKRTNLPDPKYKSEMLAKFMNMIMSDGKKSKAEAIVYGALNEITSKKGAEDPVAVLSRRSTTCARRWK